MSWERFAYICRKVCASSNNNEPISKVLAEVNRNGGSDLYGKQLANNALPSKLLVKIGALDSREEALAALNVYKKP